MNPELQRQLDWVDAAASEMERRGLIVGLQLAQSTLNALIKSYKNIAGLISDPDQAALYSLMIKKMVVGTLFEIRQAAEQASIGVLKKHGAYTEAVKAAHKRLIEATDSIPEMKDVRDGIAFHITDTLRNPQELSAMYRILDGLEIERLDNAVEATYDFVSALRQALPS